MLTQNRDTAKQAMAALREIYDGRWDRPVGTDGGRVLHWHGKCGFIGGVTPSYDRYGSIVNTLGDRYLLLRMPDVDPDKQARAALRGSRTREADARRTGRSDDRTDRQRRPAPRDARSSATTRPQRLVRLASFAARARTGVERDGYTSELEVIPQPEGPARLVKAMRRVYGALAASASTTTSAGRC